MKIGVSLPQAPEDGAATWSEILARARQAEAGGADSLWLCDHFFHRPAVGPEVGYFEAWTLLAAVGAATSRVEVGTFVTPISFRAPGLLAKMAATVDDITAGRLILGLGCGWYEPEYQAFGYPFGDRVGRFEEGLRIVEPLLHGERVTLEGRWHRVVDAVLLPPPRRRIPILIAADRPRMLGLAARHADLWQAAWYDRPASEAFRRARDGFQAACAAVGRDPATIGVAVGVNVGDPGDGDPFLALDVNAIADGLAEWAAAGAAHVQVLIQPMTRETIVTALEGIAKSRTGG